MILLGVRLRGLQIFQQSPEGKVRTARESTCKAEKGTKWTDYTRNFLCVKDKSRIPCKAPQALTEASGESKRHPSTQCSAGRIITACNVSSDNPDLDSEYVSHIFLRMH